MFALNDGWSSIRQPLHSYVILLLLFLSYSMCAVVYTKINTALLTSKLHLPPQKCAQEKYRAFAQVPENWKIVSFKSMEQELEVTASHPPPTYIAKSVGMMFHEMKSRSVHVMKVTNKGGGTLSSFMTVLFPFDLSECGIVICWQVPRIERC